MDITPLGVQYEDVKDNNAPPAGLAPELMVTESSPMTSEDRTLGRDSPDMAPVVPSEEPVQVFGYLQKKGRRLKGWHQRWFEIRGQHMYYYKTNAKKQCLGEIQLSICTQVGPSSVATFGHPFELVTKERSHFLAARSVEDMEKWISAVKKNMGPRPGPKQKKATKVKKWDSFKNAFTITRHRSVSPQRSLPADTKVNVAVIEPVTRNKSFLDKFKRVKPRESPVNRGRGADLREEEKTRPLSEDMLYSQQQLKAGLFDPPVAVSVPNTPLAGKRQEDFPTQRERTSLSPSPHHTQTPGSSTGPSLQGSPEPSAMPSPPKPTSIPVIVTKTPPTSSDEKPPVIFAKPRPLAKRSPQHAQNVKPTKKLPPLSQSATSDTLPEILKQPLAWDEIQETLASLHENTGPLFSDTLPPEDEPWLEKDSPIEQLREFLAVCA